MQPKKLLYTAEAKAHGGREGRVESSDGHLTADLSVPRDLGGPGGTGTNPEQLFAAGYSACFLSAVKLVARTKKVKLDDDTSVTVTVGVGPVDVGYALAVTLRLSVPGLSRELGNELLQGAHERCPYSKATRNNVDVELVLD